MSAVAEHLKKSKAALARSLAKVESEAKSVVHLETERKQTFSRYLGAVGTSSVAAGTVGLIETRMLVNKKGQPYLGLLPLSAIAGPALVTGAALVKAPFVKDQLAYAGAGCFGAAASHFGRLAGTAWRTKAAAKKHKRGKGKGRGRRKPVNKLPVPRGSEVGALGPVDDYDEYAYGDYETGDAYDDGYQAGDAYGDDEYGDTDGGYDHQPEDVLDVEAYDVGELEDEWTPEERELLGVA